MDKLPSQPSPQVEQSHARACFIIAGVSFAAALVGLLLNAFLAEVMAVGGMLLVSLFYLSMGIYAKLTHTVTLPMKTKDGLPFDARESGKLDWNANSPKSSQENVTVLDD